MTLRDEYLSYDPENDPTGAKGIKLADAVMDFHKGDLAEITKWGSQIRSSDPVEADTEESYEAELAQVFMEMAKGLRYDPHAVFRDIPLKVKILTEILGYKNLRTSMGRVPIRECTDRMVSEVFSQQYRYLNDFR